MVYDLSVRRSCGRLGLEANMDARISTLDSDVAAIRASVETIRLAYASKADLVGTEGRLELKIEQSKNELNLKLEISKNALDAKINQVKADLEAKIASGLSELGKRFEQAHYENGQRFDQMQYENGQRFEQMQRENGQRFAAMDYKFDALAAELRVEMKHNNAELKAWFLATAVSMFVAFGAMAVAVLKIVAP